MKYRTLPVSESRQNHSLTMQGETTLTPHGSYYGNVAYRRSLWESFCDSSVISRKAALSILSEMPVVFITWDSADQNISRNLQKSQLIQLSGKEVAAVLSSNTFRQDSDCPQSIYVFAPDLSRYVAFTHQYVVGQGYICDTYAG